MLDADTSSAHVLSLSFSSLVQRHSTGWLEMRGASAAATLPGNVFGRVISSIVVRVPGDKMTVDVGMAVCFQKKEMVRARVRACVHVCACACIHRCT